MKHRLLHDIDPGDISHYLADAYEMFGTEEPFTIVPTSNVSFTVEFENWYNKRLADWCVSQILGRGGFVLVVPCPCACARYEGFGHRLNVSFDVEDDGFGLWHDGMPIDAKAKSYRYFEDVMAAADKLIDGYVAEGVHRESETMTPIEKAREYLMRNSFDSVTKDANQWRRPLLINGESYKGTISIDNDGMCSVTISNDKGYTVFRDALSPYPPDEAVRRMNAAVDDLYNRTAVDRAVTTKSDDAPPLDLSAKCWKWDAEKLRWYRKFEAGWADDKHKIEQDMWVALQTDDNGFWVVRVYDTEDALNRDDWYMDSASFDTLAEACAEALDIISVEQDEDCIS